MIDTGVDYMNRSQQKSKCATRAKLQRFADLHGSGSALRNGTHGISRLLSWCEISNLENHCGIEAADERNHQVNHSVEILPIDNAAVCVRVAGRNNEIHSEDACRALLNFS